MGSLRHGCLVCMTVAVTFFLAILQGIHGITFMVVNNVPKSEQSKYFTPLSGDANYEKKRMRLAANFIRDSFEQWTPHDRKQVAKITLSVEVGMDEPSAHRILGKDGEIHISASHLSTEFALGGADAERQVFKELLYYEMTHILQWTGTVEDADSKALTEGIAAFMVLKIGFQPQGWAKEGEGERWNERKDVTARFLQYWEAFCPGTN